MQIQILSTIFMIIQCSIVLSFSLHGAYRKSIKRQVAMSAPLEIAGQLDPSKSWDVKFIFNGEEKTVSVKEDCSILEMGESIFDNVDSSCRNGVCTTCAAQIIEGKENTLLAVHGLGAAQVAAGYVCACQCFVTGPGVVMKLGMYDEVYELQYGQYEKSYEMKFAEKPKEEKKNMFGF